MRLAIWGETWLMMAGGRQIDEEEWWNGCGLRGNGNDWCMAQYVVYVTEK